MQGRPNNILPVPTRGGGNWQRRMCGSILAVVLLALPGIGLATPGDEWAADILTGVIPLSAWGIAHFKHDEEGEDQWLRATGISLALNSAARLAFNETNLGKRPSGHPYGFPSGHSSFVISGAAFLEDRYGWKYGVPAYLLGGYVSYQRVDSHHHHLRDVIAGAALSWAVAEAVVKPYKDEEIHAFVGPDAIELSWQHSW